MSDFFLDVEREQEQTCFIKKKKKAFIVVLKHFFVCLQVSAVMHV